MTPLDGPVRVGDRIKVTFETDGVVTDISDFGTISYERANGEEFFYIPSERDAILEVTERAKPQWLDGDVVIAKGGLAPDQALVYDGAVERFRFPDASLYTVAEWPSDTLTLVIRNGKVVSP